MDTEAQLHGARPLLPPPTRGRRSGRAVAFRVVRTRRCGRPGGWRGGGPACSALLCAVFLLLVSTLRGAAVPDSQRLDGAHAAGSGTGCWSTSWRTVSAIEPQRGDVVVFDGTGSFVRERRGPVGLHGAARRSGCGPARPTTSSGWWAWAGTTWSAATRADVEVNGDPLDERYLYPGDSPSTVPFDIVVPEGTLWVMGDHRSRLQGLPGPPGRTRAAAWSRWTK